MARIDWSDIEANDSDARETFQEAEAFCKKYQQKEARLRAIIQKEQREIVEAGFESTPIDKFSQAFPGIKLSTLQRENIRTVGELNQRISRDLPISGIGEKVRGIINDSLNTYRTELKKGIFLRFNVEEKNIRQGEMLELIHFLDKATPLYEEAQNITTEYHSIYQFPIKGTGMLWRTKWLFFSKSKKEEYQEQFEQLAEFLLANQQPVGHIQKLAETIETQSTEALWQNFEQSAARVYAFLEKFMGKGLDFALITKGNALSQEIVENIKAFELRTDKLQVSLRGWQEFAAKYALVQQKVLIGDEMGLGKTIEALAVMAHLASLDYQWFLVVCPASLLLNWVREVEKHSQLNGYAIHGAKREQLWQKWQERGGVAITTYETIQRLETFELSELDVLVVDEAHYIKNPTAKRSQKVFDLTKQSQYTLYMTGTPLENRVEEMVTLIGQLQPLIAEKISSHSLYLNHDWYKKEIAPVYLRRNQADVLSELPELTQVEEWLPFGEKEAELYKEAVVQGKFMLMRRAGWQGAHDRDSPKLQRLTEILEEAQANGKKVIVFSFFKHVIHLLATIFPETSLTPITGDIHIANRQTILEEFQQSKQKNLLLAQIQAGGIGLNIQAASIIVFCEPQVKPSLETQAIARAYRMGQTQHVFVYRLLTADSIDERLMQILSNKQQLFEHYARASFIGENVSQAKDISEKAIIKQIVQMERERLLGETAVQVDYSEEDEAEWDF